MKRTILFFAALAFSIGLSAQEKPVAKVHYQFKHINDTNKRENPRLDEVVTYLGQKGSYYTSYSSERLNQEVKKQMESPSFDGNLVLSKSSTAIDRNFIIQPEEKKILEIARFGGNTFLMDNAYDVPEWEIHDETKTIGGYTCQKATTNYKGRQYTAWFTTDLPFSFGPWKLHGLPGLILSAKDLKKEVVFEYAGFDKLDETNNVLIEAPDYAIKSTPAEVKKQEEGYRANPMAYMQAKTGGSSTTISSGSSGGRGGMTIVSGRPSGSSSSSAISGSMDPSKIKSLTVKSDNSNYKPSAIVNNPIELKP